MELKYRNFIEPEIRMADSGCVELKYARSSEYEHKHNLVLAESMSRDGMVRYLHVQLDSSTIAKMYELSQEYRDYQI